MHLNVKLLGEHILGIRLETYIICAQRYKYNIHFGVNLSYPIIFTECVPLVTCLHLALYRLLMCNTP